MGVTDAVVITMEGTDGSCGTFILSCNAARFIDEENGVEWFTDVSTDDLRLICLFTESELDASASAEGQG